MAYGNWQDIIDEYEDFLAAPDLGLRVRREVKANAAVMLPLIAVIQTDPDFADYVPITSHSTLHFKIPHKQTQVELWYWKEKAQIEVYLCHPSAYSDTDWDGMTPDDIIAVSYTTWAWTNQDDAIAVLKAALQHVRDDDQVP